MQWDIRVFFRRDTLEAMWIARSAYAHAVGRMGFLPKGGHVDGEDTLEAMWMVRSTYAHAVGHMGFLPKGGHVDGEGVHTRMQWDIWIFFQRVAMWMVRECGHACRRGSWCKGHKAVQRQGVQSSMSIGVLRGAHRGDGQLIVQDLDGCTI
eukprot:1152685-Pelagomonas_calceolata.AAC.4